MNEYLVRFDRIQMSRKKRFEQQFMDDVMSLFSMITQDITERYSQVNILQSM
jgi:hypothetical protein